MKNISIKMSRSYAAHGKSFDTLVLREPKLKDYFVLGDPTEIQPAGTGNMVVLEHYDVIAAYKDRLLVSPDAADVEDLDLVDALAVKDAITGFFSTAKRAQRARTRSSGGEDSPSVTSEN